MKERVTYARVMAVEAHGSQMYGSYPYSYHLDAVSTLCKPFGEDAQVVALLHDAIEDTDLPLEAIRAAFGGLVAACVEAVTDPPGQNRKERKKALYASLGNIHTSSPMSLALVVKAADRLANVRESKRLGNEGLMQMYRKEHQAFVDAVSRTGLTDKLVEEASALLERET